MLFVFGPALLQERFVILRKIRGALTRLYRTPRCVVYFGARFRHGPSGFENPKSTLSQRELYESRKPPTLANKRCVSRHAVLVSRYSHTPRRCLHGMTCPGAYMTALSGSHDFFISCRMIPLASGYPNDELRNKERNRTSVSQ